MYKFVSIPLAILFITIVSNLYGTFALTEQSKPSKECIVCHETESPAIVKQWTNSKHFENNIACYECHFANKNDVDAIEHYGLTIATIVTPKDCGKCHIKQVNQFQNSIHSKASVILDSLNNKLAEVVGDDNNFISENYPEGVSASNINSCWQCHGTTVKLLEDGSLDPVSWPNSGIGRINPDQSEGSCSACHSRHRFSREQARNPETCAKCHSGPDHPQMEIYNESKHGISFYTNRDKMNMDRDVWKVGIDYHDGPTCATCHMSATKDQEATHNVGRRISWNNRLIYSFRPEISEAKIGLAKYNPDWQTRRSNMKNVCINCHSINYVDNFYKQYDGLIETYNGKFAKPGLELMKLARPLLEGEVYSHEIDFMWFEMWHHEGRRARHGASMLGPNYTFWHGMYEVSKKFYNKIIPALQKLADSNIKSDDPEKAKAAKILAKKIRDIMQKKEHKWHIKNKPESS